MIPLLAVFVLTVLVAATAACLRGIHVARTDLGRVVALDVLISTVLVGVAAAAALTGSGTFVDLLLAASLVGVASSTAMARFVESREAEDD